MLTVGSFIKTQFNSKRDRLLSGEGDGWILWMAERIRETRLSQVCQLRRRKTPYVIVNTQVIQWI